jgi:hypothetical protein
VVRWREYEGDLSLVERSRNYRISHKNSELFQVFVRNRKTTHFSTSPEPAEHIRTYRMYHTYHIMQSYRIIIFSYHCARPFAFLNNVGTVLNNFVYFGVHVVKLEVTKILPF